MKAHGEFEVQAADAFRTTTLIRPEDLWDAWVAAEVECGVALCDWATAPQSRKADAYATYRAALEREEHAARRFADRPLPRALLAPPRA